MVAVNDGSVNWDMSLTVFHIKKFREQTPSVALTDPDTLAGILEDEVKQYELVWELVNKQAAQKGIDAEAFAKIFTEHYEKFATGLVETLRNFFQSSGRTDLSLVIAKTLDGLKKLRSAGEKGLSSELMGSVVDKIVANHELEIQAGLTKAMEKLENDAKQLTTTSKFGDSLE